MSYPIIRTAAAAVICILLAGCFAGSSGSAISVSQARTPVPKESVKLYVNPPKKFEVLGLVEATGKRGFSAQAKMDRAINELKEQAGKLGANGILLSSSGDKAGGVVGATSNGAFYGGTIFLKTVSGQAIFVSEE